MAFRKIIIILCLSVCLSGIFGKAGYRPSRTTTVRPGCQRGYEMQCIEPLTAYLKTSEGQQLAELGRTDANIFQIFTENVFHRLCSIVSAQTTCSADLMSKCVGPELQAGIQFMYNISMDLLSVCNETDGCSKVITVARCGERIKNSARQCFQTVVSGVMESQRQRSSNLSSPAFLSTEGYRKEYCCFAKQFHECIAPSVQSTCTTSEEKAETQKLKERILGVLQCTDAIYQTC